MTIDYHHFYSFLVCNYILLLMLNKSCIFRVYAKKKKKFANCNRLDGVNVDFVLENKILIGLNWHLDVIFFC